MAPSVFIAVNGTVAPLHAARVSPLDRGLLYGDGVFETLRTYGGQPAFLARHLRRMREAATFLRIPWEPDEAQMRALIDALLEANALRESTIRITLTRGPTPAGLKLDGAEEPTWIVRAGPLREYPQALRDGGMRLHVSKIRRNADSPLPSIKALNYLECLLAKDEALRRGADEALFLNTRGELAEGSVCNVFLVERGSVLTPSIDSGILAGITREVVLELCERESIPLVETRLGPTRLRGADEVFVTNSLMEIMPVAAVDDDSFSAPGPFTQRLGKLYRDAVMCGME